MRNILFSAFFILAFSSPAWAITETVKNTSDQTITFQLEGKKIQLAPNETAEISKSDTEENPVIYRMIFQKRLTVLPRKTTFEDCEEDDRDGYCYMDVAVDNKNTVGCAYYRRWNEAKECLYYVNRERKLTTHDCQVFDPGSPTRSSCIDYVIKGIPSKPGQTYEESLKF